MKVFIPYVDEQSAKEPLVPNDDPVMRVLRITSRGDHTNAVCKIITAIEHERAQYHFEAKRRYGGTAGKGTIDF